MNNKKLRTIALVCAVFIIAVFVPLLAKRGSSLISKASADNSVAFIEESAFDLPECAGKCRYVYASRDGRTLDYMITIANDGITYVGIANATTRTSKVIRCADVNTFFGVLTDSQRAVVTERFAALARQPGVQRLNGRVATIPAKVVAAFEYGTSPPRGCTLNE